MNPNIASIAALISDPSRAAILTSLLDGRFHPASSLAYIAGIKPQTASFHLKKLCDADIIRIEQQGRHRYYGLKDHEVAKFLESFLSVAPKPEMKSLKQVTQNKAICYARTCYDHLAGYIGAGVADAMLSKGFMRTSAGSFELTDRGENFLTDLDIDLETTKKKRRKFIDQCLDWSERRPHISGAIGHALLEKFLESEWLQRMPDSRAVKLTEHGGHELQTRFGVRI